MKKFVIIQCVLVLYFSALAAAAEPIRVLFITGRNNHRWKQTTPSLKKTLEDSGRFKVDVTEKPAEITAKSLAGYDVILNGWTGYPKVTGHLWGLDTEKAIDNFVASGKGMVSFHAGSSSFHEWAGFQKIIGGTWGKGTGHGRYNEFTVEMTDVDHPITKGMKNFKTRDELWHNLVVLQPTPGRKVLCTAMSAKNNRGTGKNEAIAVCTTFGKGRGFYTTLGHDVKALENPGCKLLMLRGVEWAATGKVTIAPAANTEAKLAWKQTDNTIALLNGDKVVWQLNHNPKKGKPCIHPLATIDGSVLTVNRPADHVWHNALWFSWKMINGLNYWEEDPKTGLSQGRTEIKSTKITKAKDFSARIEMVLSYHPPKKPEILAEKRTITISAPTKNGLYRIDWTSTFTATGTDALLDRTPRIGEKGGKGHGGYAGFSIRMAKETRGWRILDSKGRQNMKIHGQPNAVWVDASGKTTSGKQAGVTIFDHPSNMRHPAPWFIVKGMPYFSPAVLYNKPHTLKKSESLTLKYRVLVHPGLADKGMLDGEFKTFAKN
ncbi:MAG: hypothetical protein GY794_06890 [bacterium]|nr:hypothetical protein [bacterium]